MYSLLLFALVSGTQPSTPEAPAAQKAEAKEERKICKAIEVTGSRMSSKRVCMTAAQWKRSNADSRY